jgi:hypothetical protein
MFFFFIFFKLLLLYFIFLLGTAFLDFLEQQKRRPSTTSLDGDQELLNKLRTNVMENTGITESKFPPDFAQ